VQSYSLSEIAQKIDAKIQGNADIQITGLAPLQMAKAGQIAFLDNAKYRKYLQETQASAVILNPKEANNCPTTALIVTNPYVAYAKIATLFGYKPAHKPGIHETAVIGTDCVIDKTASIGPYVVIGNHVHIGANTVIESRCSLGDYVAIGNHCLLWPNVTLYHGVKIHNGVILHSGAVVGSDGFGMANDQGKWLKIPQLGTVVIYDDVEIGANTTIDRGALGDTIIEKGVKLDNQIQIGHNVHIGEYTAMAACSGVSGSTKIGKHCLISGMVGFTGHFEVADNVVITGMTMVSKAIDKPGIYSSGTAMEPHQQWKKNAVRFRQLDEMAKRIAKLEQEKKGDKNA
jgi:UDP-3-O-[3-hydroxymyristoyl] glucosamine N-acyltransferase